MPGQDRTGPQGYGPKTGGGFGPCGAGFRRGFGGGRGRGFGRRYVMQSEVITEVQEQELLERELQAIEEEKQGIAKRLKELKK